MPSFEVLVIGAPLGFLPGCAKLNAAASDAAVSALVLESAIKAYRYGSSQTSGSYCEEIKALSYIIYAREQAQPRPVLTEVAAVLDVNTVLTRESITAFCAGLDSIALLPSAEQQAAAGEVGGAEASSSLSIAEAMAKKKSGGQLFNFQWRLGVAISSSSCKALSSPYVAVTFSIRDSNGEVTSHSAEMSYAEFVEFRRVFQDVSAMLDAF